MTVAPIETGVAHERDDVNLRGVRWFGAGLAVTLVVLGALVWLLYGFDRGAEPGERPADYPLSAERPLTPPEPRLQTHPRQDLLDFRAQEGAVLTTYGWVDRPRGVVRIPIDRAMSLVVERGLPSRPEREDPHVP